MRSLRSLTQDERLFVHPEQVPRRRDAPGEDIPSGEGSANIIFEIVLERLDLHVYG